MQVFLPFPSFQKSVEVLDRKRLGKARSEALIILRALTREDYGWQNHPAVRMFEGFEWAVKEYGILSCKEWKRRGYEDNTEKKFYDVALTETGEYPDWLGTPEFHRSHRSNLVRKDPEHYREHFPDVPNDLEYVWPSKQ